MCLQTINKTKPEPCGYGWKVFERRRGELYSLYPRITAKAKYLTGRWIKAKCEKKITLIPAYIDAQGIGLIIDTYPSYIPQFHILSTKPVYTDPYDITKHVGRDIQIVTRRVRYRKAQIAGIDNTYSVGRCVVAGEIYIYKKKGDK